MIEKIGIFGGEVQRRAPEWPRGRMIWWDFCSNLSLLFLGLVYGLKLIGRERVPRHGPIIYVTNHQTHYDPVMVGLLIRDRPFAAIARASLFKVPGLAWLMRSLGAVPIERGGSGDRGAMQTALQELKAGRCVFVFPEGTRTPDGTVRAFQPGVRLLIKRSDAVVLPIGFDGAFDIWPRKRKAPHVLGPMLLGRGKISVVAGEPIEREEMGDDLDALLQRLRREIDGLRLQARADVRRRTNGAWPPPGPGDAAVGGG